MKKTAIFIIIATFLVAQLLAVTAGAESYQQISFDGGTAIGTWGGADNTRRLNVLYTTVSGTIFSGMGTHYVNNGSNSYTQYSYPFNTFVGWNATTNTLQTTSLNHGIDYADNVNVSYETAVGLSTDVDTGAVVVRYTYGDDQQSIFIGEFGHIMGDNITPLTVYTPNPSGNTSVRVVGTYYIYDYTANTNNGRASFTIVNVKKTLRGYDSTTGQFLPYVELDPVSTESFDTDNISWYFVGQVATANPDGVSYIAEYSPLDEKYNITSWSKFNPTDTLYGYNTSSDYESIGEQFLKLVASPGTPPVIPEDVLKITVNGTYNVLGKEYVEVDVPQTVAENLFGWLLDCSSGFLQFQIAPNFTIGGLMTLVVGLSVVVWMLKVFMGG